MSISRAPTTSDRYSDGSYLQSTQTWHVQDSAWKAEQIFRLMNRNGLEPDTVADIGCGAGEVLRSLSLKLTKTNFYGYELSPQAFELCESRRTERLHYFNEDLLGQDTRFDCLLCIDVFEHVDDYMGFLRRLKPRAEHKIFHIPLDISVLSVLRMSLMKQRQRVGHLHYFTQETGLATLRDCGYEVVDGFFTASFKDLPAPTFLSRLARLPRRLLFSISPRWSVRVLGGCSYIVLAR